MLNRQRRVLFVNRAFEQAAGCTAAEIVGLVCSRRQSADSEASVAASHALYPPREVLEGKSVRVRRGIAVWGVGRRWWDVEFFPLSGEAGLLGILGKITPLAVHETISGAPLPERLVALRQQRCQSYHLDLLGGESAALGRVAEQVRLAVGCRAPILIRGEAGSGKEWLARTIHYQGPYREQFFAAVNCRVLPADILGQTLVGDHGLLQMPRLGTLYLKEPAFLPRELQDRLHEFIAESPAVGPRILAGCRTDPAADIQAGRLLEAFFAVLAPVVIELPSLRQRREDLPWLVGRFLDRLALAGDPQVELTSAAWDLVRSYSWPGNMRQLAAVLALARQQAKDNRIDVAQFPAHVRQEAQLEAIAGADEPQVLSLDRILEEAERRLIVRALRQSRGNKSKAAELLSIWRPRLLRRIEALDIPDSEEKGGSFIQNEK